MSDEIKAEDQAQRQTSEQQADNASTAEPEKKFTSLIEAILQQLDVYFSEHVAELFKKADDFLFDAAEHASSIDQQNRMFEFMNDLRVQKDDIEKNFYTHINVFLAPVATSPKLPKKKTQKETTQLGLVDQDEMDEMVALTTISGKATSDFQEEISHLRARLQNLALHNQDIFHPDALLPIHICESFQEALAGTGFANQNKLILYKMFGEDIIKQIKTLYDDLNQLMIDAGILPQIELGGGLAGEGRQRAGYGGYDEGDDEAGAEAEEAADEYEQDIVPPPAYPGGYRGYQGGIRARGGAAPAQGAAPAPGTAQAAPAGYGAPSGIRARGQTADSGVDAGAGTEVPPNTGPHGQAYSAGLPVSQVRESIQNFVGGEPADADASIPSGGIGGGAYYTKQDVVSALSNMQNTMQVAPDAKLEFNAAAIKKAVLSSIADKSGGVVNKRVNQVSEKTIDFIKLIFDAIIADKSITDAIKALLLSLQIPVIKAAMIDPDFFVDDQHPARQLLDKTAEAGVGVSEHTDPIYISIDEILQKLLLDYGEDVGVFKVALDALNALTNDIHEKAREREEEAQKQVQRAHARNVVLQEIRKITLGHELPAGVHKLVLKVWPSLMFAHYLRHGKANDEWVEMLMILAKIIDSVQPLTTAAELKELGLTFEDIVAATEEKLKECKKPAALREEVITDLRATYEELMNTQGLPEEPEAEAEEVQAEVEEAEAVATEVAEEAETAPEAETMGEAAIEAEAAAEEAAEPEVAEPAEDDPEVIARRKIEALPDDVKPGAWFIVYNGKDKPVRRLKLAVILMQNATLMFVDHLGNIVIEKDAQEFTEELQQDLSGIIMQHSVFDHALNSALNNISQ